MNIAFQAALRGQGLMLERAFALALAHPHQTQGRVLKRILLKNSATAFGRDHGLCETMTADDYRAAVAIGDYESLRHYHERAMSGEAQVLSTDATIRYVTTSGTTGAPKYIPVTAAWRRELIGLNRLWLYRAQRDNPGCFSKGVMMVVSPATEGHTEQGVPYGAMSGVAQQRLSHLLHNTFVVPESVTHLVDMETRYFLTMRYALARDVSSIGTANPTTLLRLAETAERRCEELLRAIHDGGSGIAGIACAPDPKRARFLAGCAERRGALLPRDAWPNLKLIGCWLGGSAGVHAARLEAAFGSAAKRDLGLLASEGRFSMPLENETASGVLAISSNFYEFVAEDALDAAVPQVLLAHELEVGRRYKIIITALNGLWRYDMNDIVKVTGFYKSTPTIEFLRKGRDIASIVGEKVHVNHFRAAIEALETKAAGSVLQFRCILDVAEYRHDILIEYADESFVVPQDIVQCIDQAIAMHNEEYASKRASNRLKAPRVYIMKRGWSEQQARLDFASGKREQQYKWRSINDSWDDASRSCILEVHDDSE